jgi:hypothetical protein
MGDVAKAWAEHERVCEPLLRRRELIGAARKGELETLRRRCKNLLEDGRRAKRGHDWDAWQRGTEALIDACRTATTLLDRLHAGIEAASNQDRQRKEFRVNVALAIVLCVVGIVAGAALAAVLA